MNSEPAKLAGEIGTARNVTEQGSVATQGQMKLQCWEMLIRLATCSESALVCHIFLGAGEIET